MELRIDAHPDPMMGLLPMFTAIHEGMLENRGIEPVLVQRTASQAVEQMRSGEMDISFSGPTFTIMGKEKFGLDTQFISAGALRGSLDGRSADQSNLIARTDVEINKPADLEGKTLGVFELDGGITHCAPLYLFRQWGLDVSTIELKAMPFHAMNEALLNKEVDVAVCVEPLVTGILRNGVGHAVDDALFGKGNSLTTMTVGDPALVSNWWACKSTVMRNPSLFAATTEALNEAIDLIYQQPDRAMDAMAAQTGQDVSRLREIGFDAVFFYPFEHGSKAVRAMYEGWVRVLISARLMNQTPVIEDFFGGFD